MKGAQRVLAVVNCHLSVMEATSVSRRASVNGMRLVVGVLDDDGKDRGGPRIEGEQNTLAIYHIRSLQSCIIIFSSFIQHCVKLG